MSRFLDDYARESQLQPPLSTILLATRCFGRATPFPHRLIRRVLTVEEREHYEDAVAELLKKKLIRRQGKHAFEVTSYGYDWLSYRKVPALVWQAAVDAVLFAVGQAVDEHDTACLQLMAVHSRALANIFLSRYPALWFTLTGAAVICLQESGDIDDKDQADILLS